MCETTFMQHPQTFTEWACLSIYQAFYTRTSNRNLGKDGEENQQHQRNERDYYLNHNQQLSFVFILSTL
jgi:hypothetical protein